MTTAALPTMSHKPLYRGPVTTSEVVDSLRLKLETKWSTMLQAFRKMDRDGSGYLDRDEIEQFLAEFNMPRHHIDNLLRQLDTNGDGKVSFAEFSQGFQPRTGAVINLPSEERYVTNRHVVASPQVLVNDNLAVSRKSEVRPDTQLLPLPAGGGVASASELKAHQSAISDRIFAKHSKLRDAFRNLDVDKNGRLSEVELKRAVRVYNLPIPERHVEQLFGQLRGSDGQVDYEAFALALKRRDALGN